MNASFGKNLLFGCIVTLVFFVLIELILMVAGVRPLYERTDPSVGFSGYAPLFQKHNQSDEEAVFTTAPNKIQWFNMQNFPAEKDENATRIFCLGGSTTYGRPYDDRTSFCGWLRLFLPEADPSRKWEVINAGGISYASYRVARLMEELAEYEPDLFIVYTGHNEFLESRTYNEFLNVPGFLRSLSVQASRTRLYTLLYNLIYERKNVLPTEVEALLDESAGPEDYHRDDAMRDAVIDDYRKSLNRISFISDKVGADLILVTPASNIGDFSPFKSEPGNNLSEEDISHVDSLKQMVQIAMSDEDYQDAEAIVREALAIDDRDPDLLYLYGQALRSLDRIDEARSAFIRSRDEDICPLRALTPMHEIVTDVARTRNTGFVDFVAIVDEQSPDGIPGSELFLDHVHPTIEGNRLLALSIIDEMIEQELISPVDAWNEELISEISLKLENSLDEKTHAIALRNLSKVLNWAGKHDEAARLSDLAIEMIPEDSQTQVEKGISLWRAGDREAAIIHYRKALEFTPNDARIRRSLGIILSELHRYEEAYLELKEAIRLDPKLGIAYYDLGIVLQALGREMQAEAAYRTAQKMNPDHAEAYNNLGIILAQRGDFKGAYEQFARAVEVDPDNGEAARNLQRARMAMDQSQQ